MSGRRTKALVSGEQQAKVDPRTVVEQLVGNSMELISDCLIEATLARCNGNKTAAAKMLGISARTISNRIGSKGS